MTRLARAVLAATIGLAPVAAALPARAAECVRVVVDYGTFAGAPQGPNTHCTSSPSGATAAEVLAKRADELGLSTSQRPRYNGNFLCAIDGYPGTGCGDHGTEPYWSLWLWVGGTWVYSSEGVATYTVRDADKDGHPDPIGFRYHEFKTKRQPRANPGYPAPTTAPPATPSPSGAAPSHGATTAPPSAPSRPAGPGATSTPAATPVSATPAPTGVAGTTPAPTGAAAVAGPSVSAAATGPVTFPVREQGGGFPYGTLVALAIALGLGGATLVKLRRAP